MTHKSLAIAVAILFSISLTGCYSNVIAMNPPTPVSIKAERIDPSLKPTTKLFVGVKSPTGTLATKIQEYISPRAFDRIDQSGLFSDKDTTSIFSQRDTVKIDLMIERDGDNGGAFGQIKEFISVLTLGIAAPILPSTYKYDSTYRATITWPDGRVRNYSSFCSTSVFKTIGMVDQSIRQVSDSEIERCLPMVINEIGSDYPVYLSIASAEREHASDEQKKKVEYSRSSCKSLGFKQGSSGFDECINEINK